VTAPFLVSKKYWDVIKACINPTYKGYGNLTRINNHIEKQKAKSIDILTKLNEKNVLRYMSIQDVKHRITGKAKNQSVYSFTIKLIRGLFAEGHLGTARSEMLGYEKLSTTQVYLSGLKKDVLDQYNEQVIAGR